MTSVPTEAIASSDRRRGRTNAFALVRTGLSEVLGRRRLARYLVGADLKRTHADTLLGQLWWILDPLLQMAVYIVLVTIIFNRQTPDYPLFVFAAILPWKWFTTTLSDAATSVTGRQSLIRQIQFPKIVLPTASVVAGTVSFVFGLIALGIVYLFYLSPGLYSLGTVGGSHKLIQDLLHLNPFAVLFEAYRSIIWGTETTVAGKVVYFPPGPPDWFGLAVLSGFSCLLILFGVYIFKRAEPAFARIL